MSKFKPELQFSKEEIALFSKAVWSQDLSEGLSNSIAMHQKTESKLKNFKEQDAKLKEFSQKPGLGSKEYLEQEALYHIAAINAASFVSSACEHSINLYKEAHAKITHEDFFEKSCNALGIKDVKTKAKFAEFIQQEIKGIEKSITANQDLQQSTDQLSKQSSFSLEKSQKTLKAKVDRSNFIQGAVSRAAGVAIGVGSMALGVASTTLILGASYSRMVEAPAAGIIGGVASSIVTGSLRLTQSARRLIEDGIRFATNTQGTAEEVTARKQLRQENSATLLRNYKDFNQALNHHVAEALNNPPGETASALLKLATKGIKLSYNLISGKRPLSVAEIRDNLISKQIPLRQGKGTLTLNATLQVRKLNSQSRRCNSI